MRSLLWTLLLLVPAVAMGQAGGDTIKVVVPYDRNCSDFRSEQEAQGWYDGIELFYSRAVSYEPQPDPHGLDADGDGQPCESKRIAKVEDLGGGYLIRFDLSVYEYECPTVQEPFTLAALRDQAVLAATDSIPYRGASGVWPRWECVHTISQLVSQ